MDIFTLSATLLLTIIAVGLIARPLWQQQVRQPVAAENNGMGQTLGETQARYQATLVAIKDLMFDYEMGKVAAQDYETLLAKAKAEAAHLRQQLDQIKHRCRGTVSPDLDVEIEHLIAQTRAGGLHVNGNRRLVREIDRCIERLKQVKQNGTTTELTCITCATPFALGDSTCATCGQPLADADIGATDPHHCAECGYTVQPSDAFCARCGTALIQARPIRYGNGRLLAT